ncbi:unnamed protein product [Adineta ricciae]|uniref:Uncharacterized protein n=1 Tax=Adineta ricciae TaxID=249248 RepID=A0A814DGP6_ADIRI|nr:unnamed protein product [Adineta ricciae]
MNLTDSLLSSLIFEHKCYRIHQGLTYGAMRICMMFSDVKNSVLLIFQLSIQNLGKPALLSGLGNLDFSFLRSPIRPASHGGSP